MTDRDARPRFDSDPTIPQEALFRKRTPEVYPDSSFLLEQSRAHFQEAIATAATDQGHLEMGTEYTIQSLVSVAEIMAEAGIPPVPVMDRVQELHSKLPDNTGSSGINKRAWNNFALAKMYGMLGEHDNMREAIATTQAYGSFASPYIYAAEKQVREGEDPTTILNEALASMSQNNWGQVAEYAQIAQVLQRANQDPTTALTQAEEQVRKEQQESTFSDSSILELTAAYARSGFFDDASRMIELVKEDTDSDHRRIFERSIPRTIYYEQMARGHVDDAFKTAQEMGANLTGFYTQKALIEARKGEDPMDTIAHARTLLGDSAQKTYVFQEIYPVLGTALALSGSEEAATQQFASIYEAMEHMDNFNKFDTGIALAEAIDESGYDAEGILRNCLEYAEAFLAEDPDFYLYQDNANQMKERTIEEMINRGYLTAAQENIPHLSPTEIKANAVLLAKLAVAEAEKATANENLETSPDVTFNLQTLSDDEAVRDLANEFSDILHYPELTSPLHSFLTNLSQEPLPGLQGVAIAAWEEPSEQSHLAIYALINEIAQSSTASQETTITVLKAHDKLNDQLITDNSALTSGLWFIETSGEELESLAPRLPELLTSGDPFEVYPGEDKRISHLRIMKSNPIEPSDG